MTESIERCPQCGHVLRHGTYRAGVRVGPVKALIFDLVEVTGRTGLTADGLYALLTAENHPMFRQSMRTHLYQLRMLLASSGTSLDSKTYWTGGHRSTVYYIEHAKESMRGCENGKEAQGR